MKRIYEYLRIRNFLTHFAVAFFLSALFPLAVSAQTVQQRYCPNPAKDFFSGRIYHSHDGTPWVKTWNFLSGEATRDKQISDFSIRIKPEFNYYCIPSWAENNDTEVTSEDLPPSVPIQGSIIVGKNDEVVATGTFLRTSYTKDPLDSDEEGNLFIYKWEIKDWPNSLSASGIEKLAAARLNGEPIDILFEITKPDGTVEKIRAPFPLENVRLTAPKLSVKTTDRFTPCNE